MADWMRDDRTDPRLVVASYNIHGCVGTDGSLDPDRVARVVRELSADVVGLQEVDSRREDGSALGQMERIARRSGLHAIPGPTILKPDGSFGNALLTGGRVREIRRLDLSIPGREPRGALDVDLEIEGEPARVIVTHLGLRPFERRMQVRRLLDVLREQPDRITVVLGDMNEWLPGSRPIRWLHARLGKAPSVRTWPSICPLFSLDRVWVWPRRALLSVSVHRSPESRAASDHLPMKAVIALVRVRPRVPEDLATI